MKDLSPYFLRERMMTEIRGYFAAAGFHEAVVPVLNRSLPVEPTVYPFRTEWETIGGAKDLYLSVSPEAALKKLIAAGIGTCFGFGKSFRNLEGTSNRHLPEFLMLEWYRENATYTDIMAETERLTERIISVLFPGKQTLSYQGYNIHFQTPWKRMGMTELFADRANLKLGESLSDEAMQEAARAKGYATAGATWEQLFNQIFLNEIEPTLGPDPVFVTDFPARISPLCALQPGNPDFSQRFELYMGGMEIGNGNTERTDAEAVRTVFEKESAVRKPSGKPGVPIDHDFLYALSAMAGKNYAGIGIGIDRLAMIFADVSDIRDVEFFAIPENA